MCILVNDKTITVYNAHKGSDGKDIWKRTVIYGVEYFYGYALAQVPCTHEWTS